MEQLLSEQLVKAIQDSRNLHTSCINRDYLALFVRAAKADPQSMSEVIDILLNNIKVNRSNLVGGLYALGKLADISPETKMLVKEKIGDDFVKFYEEDEDPKVSGNAKVLNQVLQGASFSQFEKPSSIPTPPSVTYNINNSNFAVGSPNANLNLKIQNYDQYDPEVKKLLGDLKEAIESKNKPKVTQILQFLVDKGFDLLVAILSGQILKG